MWGVTPIAIVHDYVVERAGSERVLLTMHRAFPDAPIHTAFYRPSATYAEFAGAPIEPFAINRIGALRERHRAALPLLPFAFGRHRVDARVVLCGTSGWSAGVPTPGRKVLYMHAPTRWLHDQQSFLAGRSTGERLGLRLIERPLHRWDSRAVRSGDRHLVGSRAMADTVRAIYGIEAEVLPPPVTLDPSGPACPPSVELDDGFLLVSGRLVANKRIEVLVEALRARPGDRLVVAGDGPEAGRVRAAAPPNVVFLGAVDDATLRWLYARCRAVLSASNESFGLALAEGASFGRPAVALAAGGTLDTVVVDVTGVLFERVESSAVVEALERLDGLDIDARAIAAHAEQWSESRFVDRLRAIVAEEGAVGGD